MRYCPKEHRKYKYNNGSWKNVYGADCGGKTSATLTVPATADRKNLRFRCAVTNSAGTVYSNEAVLTIDNTIVDGNIIYERIDGETARVYKYNGTQSASVTVKGTISGLTVVEVGASAFENHTELTSVDLPDSIRVIGKRAFAGCTSLSTMN